MILALKYFGANGWLVEVGDKNILIDPWLTGELIFPTGQWLLKGKLVKAMEFPIQVDLILISQGLEDHCHIQTLKKLNKEIPVIASSSGSKKVRSIGFKDVTELKHSQETVFSDLVIEATAGAAVPNIENGYLIKHHEAILYYEPHGWFDSKIKTKVDVAITPVVNIGLPLLGNFIQGQKALKQILEVLEPKHILASTTGGEIEYTGLISSFIKPQGRLEEIRELISEKTSLIDPLPGKRYVFNIH